MLTLNNRLLVLVSIFATALALYGGYAARWAASPQCGELHMGYLGYGCAGHDKPHQSSWDSWWHPQWVSGGQFAGDRDAGKTDKDWNILYHLGGYGPWIEKVDDIVEGGIAVPKGCEVEQVHMMSRHAERYPTIRAGRDQKAVVDRMRQSGIHFTGALAFFNNWTLFWDDDAHLEQLTTTGPFSGRLGAFSTGVRLRTRYQHLLPTNSSTRTTYWSTSSPRVIDTAQHFAHAFFGPPQNTSHLVIIPESTDRAADTLTPGRTCPPARNAPDGKKQGYRIMYTYRRSYLGPARARLLTQTNGKLNFTDAELFSMQELCGFETIARGHSPWCSVFTRGEFLAFEYARDLVHFYRAGPGMRYAGAMGSLWVNATTELLVQGGEAAGRLFFSFVHDGDVAPMVAALGVLDEDDGEMLPTGWIREPRRWKKSQVSPMGGRVLLELLACGVGIGEKKDKFVRVNINDGVTALRDCQAGPGKSCPLGQFAARTRRRTEQAGDFRDVCGLSADVAGRITFLHQRGENGDGE